MTRRYCWLEVSQEYVLAIVMKQKMEDMEEEGTSCFKTLFISGLTSIPSHTRYHKTIA